MEKSVVKQWWFWLLIIVVALGIGFGVNYVVQNNSDEDEKTSEKSEKKEKKEDKDDKEDEEEPDNPFVGTWYLPASEGIITLKFKSNGKCSFSQNGSTVNCSYEYDDEEVTIINEDFEADPITSEYSVGKGYIEFIGERMYTSKAKAEKDME